jgi:hypothetical protein
VQTGAAVGSGLGALVYAGLYAVLRGAAERVCCSAESCRAQTLIDLQPDLRRPHRDLVDARTCEGQEALPGFEPGRTQR